MKNSDPAVLFFLFLLIFSASVCTADETGQDKNGAVLKQQTTQKTNCPVRKEGIKDSNTAKTLTGFWKTDFADLCLVQSGNKVTGSYNYKGGQLKGTIIVNRLDYSWSQEDGKKGKGYFIISDNWETIDGRYGYQDNSTSGGKWSGKREDCPTAIKDQTR